MVVETMTPDELRTLADTAEKTGWTNGDDVRARFWLHDNAPDLARLCAELGETAQRAYDEPYESGTWWKALGRALASLAELEDMKADESWRAGLWRNRQ